jgi:hypothetical protein
MRLLCIHKLSPRVCPTSGAGDAVAHYHAVVSAISVGYERLFVSLEERRWSIASAAERLSGAGEFHPRALSEPDVSLSTHPAPVIPSSYGTMPIFQCANNVGCSRASSRNQCVACRWCFRNRLYFRCAHRTSRLFNGWNVLRSAEG